MEHSASQLKDHLSIIKADITTLHVDVIVNAAGNTLLGGGGMDGAIHDAAGPGLLEECRKLGGCRVGEAKITRGYDLPAKFVIHTVGPYWHGGHGGEPENLRECYLHSLQLAREHGLSSIAFPAVSTGVFCYPKDKAAKIAVETVLSFLREYPDAFDRVILTAFSDTDYTYLMDEYLRQTSGEQMPGPMDPFMQAAYEEALTGRKEGGIPIGGVLVHQGVIVGRGHNRRVQLGNPILHGEIDTLSNAGRHPAEFYRNCVLYTTLSPCIMCSGAILLYRIPEVVVGEDVNYPGEKELLMSRGVKVTILNNKELIGMMKKYIEEEPEVWNEDISEE